MDAVWGLPRCVWARESTAPAQGNQSLSRELRASVIGKDSDAGRDWGQKEKGRQRIRWLDGITDSMHVSLGVLRALSPAWDRPSEVQK